MEDLNSLSFSLRRSFKWMPRLRRALKGQTQRRRIALLEADRHLSDDIPKRSRLD